ncbi:hypothetical protein BC834DRAFT_865731 [Gloeopeniophorella convolvens]|nr:hypothetical protein BC834DRAFT_865731 [Gloeopeniophorella convolvens]
MATIPDPRFALADEFGEDPVPSSSKLDHEDGTDDETVHSDGGASDASEGSDSEEVDGLGEGMDADGFSGPKVVKPLTPEALALYKAVQEKAGVIYISRIPPGMQPTKVRHLMGQYGEVGRVYLQKEDAKRAYLRRKYTTTKKPHYTEGWVEFKDKRVARSVAEMLNAQPIGGKKGTRWREDLWTLKYLPKFKWHMLTEQVAHEAAMHTARLRLELSQSKSEQREYLKNVELARVLDKREERSKAIGKEFKRKEVNKRPDGDQGGQEPTRKRARKGEEQAGGGLGGAEVLSSVLGSVF